MTRAEKREQAIENLGGVCIACGANDTLEIDHIDPGGRAGRDPNGRRPKLSGKAIRDASAGRTDGLQLLCGIGSVNRCHQKKTTAERRARKVEA